MEIEELNEKLKQVVKQYNELKRIGFSSEVLEIYLMHKCNMKRKQVREMLKHMDKFYNTLVKQNFAERI